MCDVCRHGFEAAKAIEDKMIADHGFSIRHIAGGMKDTDPAFTYTVGRSPAKPEFYINKLGPDQSAMLISTAVQLLDDGQLAVSDGLVTDALIGNGYRVRFEACEPRAALMSGVITRNQYYAPETFQILWPDAEGRLQGEEGFDDKYLQPTFPVDVERIFVEYDKDTNPVPSTAVCSKHAHRGEEFSAEAGTSMHAPSDDPTLVCQVCSGKGL